MTAKPAPSKEVARLRLYILSILIDIMVLGLGFALANILVLHSLTGEPGKPHGLVMFAMIAPVYTLIAVNGGVYGIRMIGNRRASAAKAIWSLAQAAMLMLIIVYLGKVAEQLSRLTFLVGLLISAASLYIARLLIERIGIALLGEVPHITVLLVDGVDIETPREAWRIDAAAIGVDPAQRDAGMAERLAHGVGGAERVVVACPPDRIEAWRIALTALSAKGEILVPELRRFAPAKVSAFDDHPTIVVAGGPLLFRDRIVKRLLDLAIGVPAVLVLSPVLVAAAIAVKLSGPGPVFFRQQRIGKDGRPFMIFKFRTMHTALTDSAADKLTEKDDPRVSRVGAFLRRTSIDELPQLLNVLKGDMSIVGPRPHAPAAKAADSLYWEVDERYWARHCIKPGMTGLAQVRGHRGPTDRHEDLINRLQSDLEYVTNWSIWRDLRIIVATLGVLAHDNAF
ncbi:exopolysaccharide biosynthesis polyprenyl glycosylphosphotransferase [Sphingobium nicotianae]|uniref:Exopolysaccharide biosynthesis polyprenyl glycosylphosphotransferase n=1 Tax=Sphingobium nicotianae TaxID=2782607 RepID=A0A9X1D9E0_9SPHN|nr:exopolysaccharide biosynthesis polyprenyl glycosylphosphotransferase [Sphingobium nicotianae]MBT2185718.1 exopolysaccharide biosynthesis polyprenyl glycosylphosphotransferase [Sphingobium nicotianae]